MSTNLRQHATSGIKWTGISSIGVTVIQFIQTAILGRLFGPEVFGIMTMVQLTINYSQLFARMGLSEAIIQQKEPTQLELSSLYWINVLTGFFTCFCLFLLSPLIANYFDEPSLTQYLRAVSSTFFISGFGLQFQTLMQKELKFKMLGMLELASFAVNFVLSIYLAIFRNLDVWAIVWGVIAGICLRTLILTIYGWQQADRPRIEFNWRVSWPYIQFGLYRVAAMSLNFLTVRIDQLLIGGLLGAEALGYYGVAWNLVIQPIQKLTPIVTRVAFPLLSKLQDNVQRLRNAYIEMIDTLMIVNSVAMIGMAAIARNLVQIYLGDGWEPVVVLIPILAVYSLLRSLGNPGGALMMAMGHASWTLWWNIALTILIAPTVYFASLSGSVVIVALSLVMIQPISHMIHYYFIVRRILGNCLKAYYLQSVWLPIFLALLMGLGVSALNFFLLPESKETFDLIVQISLSLLLGAILYVGVFYIFRREQFSRYQGYILESLPFQLGESS